MKRNFGREMGEVGDMETYCKTSAASRIVRVVSMVGAESLNLTRACTSRGIRIESHREPKNPLMIDQRSCRMMVANDLNLEKMGLSGSFGEVKCD
jgi:hypothetical protein